MVEVFKTNVYLQADAGAIVAALHKLIPEGCINFDLEDCDCILRIEAPFIPYPEIEACLQSRGYVCEILL